MTRQTIEIEKACKEKRMLVLILVTGGSVSNSILDKQAIKNASDLPIGIRVVKIGDGFYHW